MASKSVTTKSAKKKVTKKVTGNNSKKNTNKSTKKTSKKVVKKSVKKPSQTLTLKTSTKVDPQQQALKVVKLLKKYYPGAFCGLDYETPFQLLIATILSAQCTDARVNLVTPELFKKYPDAHAMAKAPLKKIEELIKSTGFYNNKAKNIKACCETLVEKYEGEVPKELPKLIELGGVGRKTANVVLGNAFGIASGVVVDTHVTRLSNRLGLLTGKNAVILERTLNELIPQKHWVKFPHWMITHGREVCKARGPKCEVCFMQTICPQIGVEAT